MAASARGLVNGDAADPAVHRIVRKLCALHTSRSFHISCHWKKVGCRCRELPIDASEHVKASGSIPLGRTPEALKRVHRISSRQSRRHLLTEHNNIRPYTLSLPTLAPSVTDTRDRNAIQQHAHHSVQGGYWHRRPSAYAIPFCTYQTCTDTHCQLPE